MKQHVCTELRCVCVSGAERVGCVALLKGEKGLLAWLIMFPLLFSLACAVHCMS